MNIEETAADERELDAVESSLLRALTDLREARACVAQLQREIADPDLHPYRSPQQPRPLRITKAKGRILGALRSINQI
jgi:hypothetical protein